MPMRPIARNPSATVPGARPVMGFARAQPVLRNRANLLVALLALQAPQLVGLALAAIPALHRRSRFLRAVADVQAKAVLAHQLGEIALRLGLPALIGPGRA